MVVFNGYIKQDLVKEHELVRGNNGTYLDIEVKLSLKGSRPMLEIFQQSTRKQIGKAFVGFQNEPLSPDMHGTAEINMDRIEWDHGIWVEGHLTITLRDIPNHYGNSVIIETDVSHKSMKAQKVIIGSGIRTDLKAA